MNKFFVANAVAALVGTLLGTSIANADDYHDTTNPFHGACFNIVQRQLVRGGMDDVFDVQVWSTGMKGIANVMLEHQGDKSKQSIGHCGDYQQKAFFSQSHEEAYRYMLTGSPYKM